MHTFLLQSFDSLRGYAGRGKCDKISASGQGVNNAMKTEKDVQRTSAENQIVNDERNIQTLIKTIRGVQVILDRDVSRLYGVATGALNRQVKRNEERFPEDFMFRLSAEEWDNLKCQIGISSWGGDLHIGALRQETRAPPQDIRCRCPGIQQAIPETHHPLQRAVP